MLPPQGASAFAACMEQECAAGDSSEDDNPGNAAGVLSVGVPSGADKPQAEQAKKVCCVSCLCLLPYGPIREYVCPKQTCLLPLAGDDCIWCSKDRWLPTQQTSPTLSRRRSHPFGDWGWRVPEALPVLMCLLPWSADTSDTCPQARVLSAWLPVNDEETAWCLLHCTSWPNRCREKMRVLEMQLCPADRLGCMRPASAQG